MSNKKVSFDVEVDASDAVRELKKLGQSWEDAGKDAKKSFTGLSGALAKSNADINGVETTLQGMVRAFDAVKAAGGDAFEDDAVIAYIEQLGRMGASMDEIEQEADQVAASLKRATDVNMGTTVDGADRVAAGLRRAKGNTDEFTASAQKSRNATANMFGNAAQDLGALVGLSGSAGVALGQLAEGASDAANDGETMGSVFKGVASSVGPIAAIAAVTLVASKAMEAYGSKAKKTAEDTKAVAESILEQSDAVNTLNEALAGLNQGGPLSAQQQFLAALFDDPQEINKTAAAMDVLGISIDGLGPIFNAMEADSTAALDGLALSAVGLRGPVDAIGLAVAEAMSTAVEATDSASGALDNFDALARAAGVPDDVIQSYRSTVVALEQINDAQQNTDVNAAAQQQLVYAEALGRVNDVAREALQLARDRAGPNASDFDVWRQYVDIINQLQTAFGGLNPLIEQNAEDQQKIKDIGDAITTGMEDQTNAIAEGIQAWKDHTTAVQEAGLAIADVLETVPDLAGGLADELDNVNDVFDGLKFDVDFKPALGKALDDLDGFKPDFETLADEWSTILAGKPVDIFGNVRADDAEFLDKVSNLRNLIQTGIVNEFEQGGKDAADTFLQSNAATIAASSGLSIADVYKIMGLPPDGSVDAIIEPIVDADRADKARAILNALAGVGGDEAREARIHVALETGAIDGDIAFIAAQLLAHDDLGIPTQLDDFTQEDIDKAQAFLDGQIWTASIVPDVPVSEQNRTDHQLNALADDRTATYETETPDAAATNTRLDNVALGILGRIWPGGAGRVATYRTEAPGLSNLNRLLDAVAAPPATGGARVADFLSRVHEGSRLNAVRTLDNVANPGGQPRTAVITVVTSGAPSIGGGSVPNTGGQSAPPLGVSTAMAPSSLVSAPSAVTMAAPVSAGFTANLTINTGVLGNHFDVERTITRALRRSARINGRRAVAVR